MVYRYLKNVNRKWEKILPGYRDCGPEREIKIYHLVPGKYTFK